ncbi:MAG: hypothetical protein GX577_12665 [Leptolinea sp.]|nr:hypothetical protein [Leptolinea sp.]
MILSVPKIYALAKGLTMQKKALSAVFLLFFLASCNSIKPQPETIDVFLSSLESVKTSIGFSDLGVGVNPFSENSLVEGQTISVKGTPYPNGLFAHAPSRLTYELGGEYQSLSGTVMMHDGIRCGDGVTFQIWVDGTQVFSSDTLKSGDAAVPFSVDLSEANELELVVNSNNNKECDWSVWGDPLLKKLTGEIDKPQAAVRENSQTPVYTATVTATPEPTNTPEPTATPKPSPTPTPTEHPGWLPEGALQRWGNGAFYDMAASPDSRTLAVATEGGIYLLDPASGRVQDFLELAYAPLSLIFSPDGKHLYIGLGLGGVQVRSVDGDGKWQVEKTIKDLCGRFIKVSPDGNTLLAKCFSKKDKSFKAWDLTTDKQIFNLNYQIKITNVFAMDFSPTDPTRAAFARGNILAIIDMKTGRDIKTFTVPETKIITDVDFSPDGKTIAVSPYTSEVILLDAETLEEKQRVASPSEVQMLTYASNEELIYVTKDSCIKQNIDGSNRHIKSHYGYPMHAYLPKYNLLALASDAIDIIDLNEFNYKYTINKFASYHWMGHEFTSDGQSFYYYPPTNNVENRTYYKGTIDKPDKTTILDVKAFCQRSSPRFADNKGDYYYVNCLENKTLVVVDSRSQRVVSRYENPLDIEVNTTQYSHPWDDENEYAALLYGSGVDSSEGFRIVIVDLVSKRYLSRFNIDSSTKDAPNIAGFSPSSKYLVILSSDKKEYQIYNTDDGALVQTIKVTLADTRKNDYPTYDLIKDETLFLIRKGKTAELVSMETGQPIAKYLALKRENFEYVESIDRLVNYSYRYGQKKNFLVLFDVYPLDSNKIEKAYSVNLPYAGETIDEEQDLPNTYSSCKMGDGFDILPTYLVSVDDTLKAIIMLQCSSTNTPFDYNDLKSFRHLIYKVDVPGESIELMYKYYPDFTWFTHTYLFDDKFYTVDDSHIFVWDMAGD